MWNVGINTFNEFECIDVHYLGYFGPISLTFLNAPNTLKQVYTNLASDGLYPRVRLHFMWYVEFNTLDDFFCISSHDLGEFGPNFSDLSQFLKYTKAGINWPSDGLYILPRLHLIWNVEFNTLDDFLCYSAHNMGYLSPISLT